MSTLKRIALTAFVMIALLAFCALLDFIMDKLHPVANAILMLAIFGWLSWDLVKKSES